MTDLPQGWERTTLGEIAKTALGKMLDRGKSGGYRQVPYLRNVNVQWGHISLDDVLTMEIPDEQLEMFRLREGDLLVCEGGEIGRCAIWHANGEYMAFQKALHRVQPAHAIQPQFLQLNLENLARIGSLTKLSTGSTIKHLPQIRLREVPINLPPLAEQSRIVDQLDNLLSQLDRAEQELTSARRRIPLAMASIRAAATECHALASHSGTLADVVERVEAGRSFGGTHRPAAVDEWAIIKVSAMTYGIFRESENKYVDAAEANPRYEIRPGDLLVSRANTEAYVGAPVLVGQVRPRLLLSDKSLRLVPRPGVDRSWLLHVLASPAVRSYVSRVATGTKDSMRNISQAALLQAPILILPPDRQRRIAADIDERLADLRQLGQTLDAAQQHAAGLRRAVLADAFAGRLVAQDPNDEPASVLLDRIRAERLATPQRRAARRS